MNVEKKHRAVAHAWVDGAEVEWRPLGSNEPWRPIAGNLISWAEFNEYRIKPTKPTKPSIDWSHVDKRYNWLAKNDDGNAFLYDRVPWSQGYAFVGWAGSYVRADAFSSYSPGTCDWRDSLIVRPGYEG